MAPPEQFQHGAQDLPLRFPRGPYPGDFAAGTRRMLLAALIMWFKQFYTFSIMTLLYYIN